MQPLDREIAALAIPASLALATDPLYDLTDTAILGHIGTPQLAGAAIAARLLALGYAVFVFLMFGTTAAVARLKGAGEEREASEQGIGAVWLAMALGIIAAGVFALIGRPAIAALGGRGEVAEHAWTYLSVSLAGLPAFMIVMVGVGFHRGARDTRTPLAIAAGTVTLNLVVEVILVFGLGYGVGASAFGTVIAKWVGASIYLALIARDARRTEASWRPDVSAITGQLKVGRDLVLRTMMLLGVITAAQTLAANVGVVTLAAHAIAFQLWMFAAYGIDGIEAAGQALVAHRLGAANTGDADRVSRRLLMWALIVGVALGLILAGGSRVIPHIFTTDPVVDRNAAVALLWVAALQPVNAVAFALDGILVGAGQQRYLAQCMALAGGVFLVAATAVTTLGLGLGGIWASRSLFMLTRSALGYRYVHRGLQQSLQLQF